jgi:cytochrome P450
MALPPGPRAPAALQTLRFLAAPEASQRAVAKRYGHLYTVKNLIFGIEVIVADPELIKQVFTGDTDVFYAGEANAGLGALVGDRSLLLLDGAAHLRERRRMMPPFHGERMQSYAATMQEITEQVISTWREGEALSLHEPMQRITLEIILRTVFGLAQGARRDELRDKLASLMNRIQSPLGILMMNPALQRDLGPLTPWAAFVRERREVNEILYAEIAQRRAALASPEGKRRDDVLSLLLEAKDEEGQGMTDEELRDELMTLLTAGHETTATALCWAFEQILLHPEVHAQILAELDAVAPEGQMQGEQLSRLEYLDATIKEALRLRPIIPVVARRTKAKVVLGGYEIPAETLIVPSVYNTHRRADLYPEPDAFKPERFLGKKPDPYAWLPFGGGVRRCLGMAFALYELKIVLATVLRSRELRLKKHAPLRVVLRSFVFAPAGGTPVVIEGRRQPIKDQAHA